MPDPDPEAERVLDVAVVAWRRQASDDTWEYRTADSDPPDGSWEPLFTMNLGS